MTIQELNDISDKFEMMQDVNRIEKFINHPIAESIEMKLTIHYMHGQGVRTVALSKDLAKVAVLALLEHRDKLEGELDALKVVSQTDEEGDRDGDETGELEGDEEDSL